MKARQPKQIAAYHHKTESAPQEPDRQPGNYYVSVFDRQSNDGWSRLGLLLGPFTDHAECLAQVAAARSKAHDACADAVWYSFGTVRMADNFTQPGVLNKFFPELFPQPDLVTV